MADYIPIKDADFDDWANNFDTVVLAAPTTYGETTTTASALDAAFGTWHDAYANVQTKQAELDSLYEAKDVARASLIDLIRAMVNRMQSSSVMTDIKRALLRIARRDTTHTPAAAPATVPVLSIDTSFRLRHTINFADQGTPTSKAKPAGVMGCEIWMKVGGPPPGDVSDCEYLATDAKTPYVANFDSAQGGQTVHYLARWLSTRSEPGPWAETVSATVGA